MNSKGFGPLLGGDIKQPESLVEQWNDTHLTAREVGEKHITRRDEVTGEDDGSGGEHSVGVTFLLEQCKDVDVDEEAGGVSRCCTNGFYASE